MIGILNSDDEFTNLSEDAIKVKSIDSKNIDMQINFENPEILSLGS